MNLIIGIILLTLCTSQKCNKWDEECEGGHPGLTLVNESNKTISWTFYWNYPDTLVGDYNPALDGTDGQEPGESFTRGAGRKTCWEEVFSAGKKEWIYIFDRDSISSIDWEVVRQTNRGLLERRLVDLEYLQKHDFKITYP